MRSWFSLVADWYKSKILLKKALSQMLFNFFWTAFIQNTSKKRHPTYLIFPLSSLNSTSCILNLVFWIKLHGGVGRIRTNGGGAKINTKSKQKIVKIKPIFRKLCRSLGSWQRVRKTVIEDFTILFLQK